MLRRLRSPRAVAAALVGVITLAIASWILGDVARNRAIARLHSEVNLVSLESSVDESQALEWQAIGVSRLDPGVRRDLAVSRR